jgi:SAM-dependent methyltransferase
MAPESFDSFLQRHSLYNSVYERLLAASRLMAVSSQLVYELHSETLGPVADDILPFVDHHYPLNYTDNYIARVGRIAELQKRFDTNPTAATLGDSSVVQPEDYCLALLLSIVLTNHRFEIMEALTQFLRTMGNIAGANIVSIGSGTGYELKLIGELLPGWTVESYDSDPTMRIQAQRLLDFFRISKEVYFADLFPLDCPAPEMTGRYDAIILCEVLEHLHDPAQALRTLRACLGPKGKVFVTMAINIAQEDHVFLYPDIQSCRLQLHECGLSIEWEWLAPQAIRFLPENREIGFKKGNYIAVVSRQNSSHSSH